MCDEKTLEAVIANRYDVLARYARSLKATYRQELERLGQRSREAEVLKSVKVNLVRTRDNSAAEQARIAEVRKASKAIDTALTLREELATLWARSSASREQLLKQLQEWCHKAESSGVTPLVEFSRRLRCYA